MEEEIPPLAEEKMKRVKDLFKEWDIDGSGLIEIKALKGVTVSVGAQESQVFSQLMAMDYNGDGFVEQSVRFCHARRHRKQLPEPLHHNGGFRPRRCGLHAARRGTAATQGFVSTLLAP